MGIVEDIPQDIVREIFSHFSSTLAVYETQDFPWYLGHICATWRAVFFSMKSQFWKDIMLEWPHFPLPRYTQRVMEILRFFLRCNQGLSFSFTLCTNFSIYADEEVQDIIQVLLILVSESTRWQDVSMKLRASMLPTLYRIKHNLPLLRSLELLLCSDDHYDYSIPELYSDVFKTAPLLTSISVNRLSTWNFNWPSLTFIHLDHALNISLLYTALPSAVRLKGLEIDEQIFCRPMIYPIELIKLPCLTYLRVVSSGFLKVLEAPSLLDLQIYSQKQDVTREINIIDFIHRSSCTLRHLSFGNRKASAVKQVLLCTPKVRYLCLEHIGNVADLFTWLSSKNEQAPGPLAHLEALRVCGDHELGDEVIEDLSLMVASRASGLHTSVDRGCLKKLTIDKHWSWRTSNDALERLRSLCRVLGVELQYPCHIYFCKFCHTINLYRTYETL